MKYVIGKKVATFNRKLATAVAALAIIANSAGLAIPFILTSGTSATTTFSQGFETNTDGWVEGVTQVASGTNGITSASGTHHATAVTDAFTRFNGYKDTWNGTWTAKQDVYLDPSWAAGSGFDYSVAASNNTGAHLRDFIFHLSKDTSTNKLLVAADNNSNASVREDLETVTNHAEITSAGWYTMQHVFSNVSGVLSVNLSLLNSSGSVVFTETRSTATDTIPSVVGGNRYGWFTVISLPSGLAIDNTLLDAYTPPTIQPCTTTTTTHTTDLSTWNLSETRSTGHNELVSDGLRIWTEGTASTDKAAGYYPADFSLKNLGDTSIDYSATTGTTNPGLQLVTDFDNNGTTDGILVGESVFYGSNWWTSASAAQFVRDAAPRVAGGGSAWNGSINQWLAAFPDAKVKAIGYSLGSGVLGDGVIKRITLGCVNYTFAKPVVPPTITSQKITNPSLWGDSYNILAQPNHNSSSTGLPTIGGNVNVKANFADETILTNVIAYLPGRGFFADSEFTPTPTNNATWQAVPQGEYSVAWDTKNGTDWRAVPDGNYTFTFAARDADNGQNQTQNNTALPIDVTVDNTVPTVTLTNPTPANNSTVKGTITISADFNDANGLMNTYCGIHAASWQFAKSWPASGSDSCNYDTTTLPDGEYYIRVAARDKAGNETPFSLTDTNVSRRIIVDNTAPTVSVKGKSNTYTPTSIGSFATDTYKNVSFKLFDNGSKIDKLTLNGVAKDLTNSNWSDLNNVAPGQFGAVEGQNTLVVYDVAGNSTTYTFTLDTTAPIGTLSYSPSTLTNQNVTVTLDTNEPIDQSVLPGTWLKKSDTRYQKVYPVNTTQTVTLSDLVGNTSTVTVDINWIDKTIPLITIAAPSANQIIATRLTDQKLTVSGTFIDNTGPNYAHIQIVDAGGNSRGLLTVYGNASGTFSGQLNAATLEDGTYTVFVWGTDFAGNVSDRANTFTVFKIDNTRPTTTLVTPTSDAANPTSVVLSAQDEQGLKRVTANLYDATNTTLLRTCSQLLSGETSFTLNCAIPSLADGTYTIRYNAQDSAGNVSSTQTSKFTISTATNNSGEDDTPDDNTPTTPATTTNPPQVAGANTNTPNNIGGRGAGAVLTPNTFVAATNTTDTATAGEVESANTSTPNSQVLAAETTSGDTTSNGTDKTVAAKGCYKIFGICWYYWIPVVIAVIATIYYIASRRDEDDKK